MDLGAKNQHAAPTESKAIRRHPRLALDGSPYQHQNFRTKLITRKTDKLTMAGDADNQEEEAVSSQRDALAQERRGLLLGAAGLALLIGSVIVHSVRPSWLLLAATVIASFFLFFAAIRVLKP